MAPGDAGNTRTAEIEIDIRVQRAGDMTFAPSPPAHGRIREREATVEDSQTRIVEPARDLGRVDERPEAHRSSLRDGIEIEARDPAGSALRCRGIAREHERIVPRDHVRLRAREAIERRVSLDQLRQVVEHGKRAY